MKSKTNPVGGIVEKGVLVELAVEIQDAVIYYTTDGSYPMENPNLYAEPICVDRPLLVNALAYHKDYGLSELLQRLMMLHRLKRSLIVQAKVWMR